MTRTHVFLFLLVTLFARAVHAGPPAPGSAVAPFPSASQPPSVVGQIPDDQWFNSRRLFFFNGLLDSYTYRNNQSMDPAQRAKFAGIKSSVSFPNENIDLKKDSPAKISGLLRGHLIELKAALVQEQQKFSAGSAAAKDEGAKKYNEDGLRAVTANLKSLEDMLANLDNDSWWRPNAARNRRDGSGGAPTPPPTR